MTSAISMGKPTSILATNLVFNRPVVNMALRKAADNRVNTGIWTRKFSRNGGGIMRDYCWVNVQGS
jgi:hypothetical protein